MPKKVPKWYSFRSIFSFVLQVCIEWSYLLYVEIIRCPAIQNNQTMSSHKCIRNKIPSAWGNSIGCSDWRLFDIEFRWLWTITVIEAFCTDTADVTSNLDTWASIACNNIGIYIRRRCRARGHVRMFQQWPSFQSCQHRDRQRGNCQFLYMRIELWYRQQRMSQ